MFTKEYAWMELKSFFTTFLAFLIVDGAGLLLQIYNGNWTKEVMFGLLLALGRSAVKALLTLLFPKHFPVVSKGV